MNKDHEEIERKLKELESAVLKEEVNHSSAVSKATSGTTSLDPSKKEVATTSTSTNSDLCYFGGIGLILAGIFMLFNHIRIGTGIIWNLGMAGQGGGLILLPLLIGFGWLVYDSKNKLAWLLTAGTCAVIFFSILSSLVMSFPQMTLLGSIVMLAPLAIGTALVLKGMGGPKGIEDKLKK